MTLNNICHLEPLPGSSTSLQALDVNHNLIALIPLTTAKTLLSINPDISVPDPESHILLYVLYEDKFSCGLGHATAINISSPLDSIGGDTRHPGANLDIFGEGYFPDIHPSHKTHQSKTANFATAYGFQSQQSVKISMGSLVYASGHQPPPFGAPGASLKGPI